MSRHVLLVVGLLGFGCDVRSPPPAPLHPTRLAAAPAAPPTPPDTSLGDGFELRPALRDGRLALVPIVATHPRSQPYAALHESMQRGAAVVRESPNGFDVEHVLVDNLGADPLFVLHGELILDAQQDRVVAESAVIPPRQSRNVRVRCVESSRAEGGTRFRSPGLVAELPLRRAVAHLEQSSIWRAVDQINAGLGLSPETHTYRHAASLLATGPIALRRDRLLSRLAAHPDRPRMVGVAVALDGRVVGLDRFATPSLYRRLEPLLLASYIAGASGPPHEGQRVTPDAIRALLRFSVSTEASLTALLPPD